MVRIGLCGARGRMGAALVDVISTTDGVALAGAIERPGHADVGQPLVPGLTITDDIPALMATTDVVIDFSTPAALRPHLDAAVLAGRPLVIGTTGFEPFHEHAIDEAARAIPILQSANMSLGITLLLSLVRDIASRIGEDWDIEILEMHHRAKVDAPSGTALRLGRAAAAGRGVLLPEVEVRSRDGITGARERGAIGFATLRGGTVAGDHTVIFAAEQERLELTHRAESRAIFARGAVRAAQWLVGKPAGRYAMTDVLGLPE
jgi:4-hydroxy-tetrahydrodipicolinate reductase